MDAERLDYLLAAWLVDGLTDAEGRELADLARRDEPVRSRLADLALVHRLLPEVGPPPARATADAVLARLRTTGAVARAETVTEQDRPAGMRASQMRVQPRPARTLWPWLLAAALVALAVGGVLLWRTRLPDAAPAAPAR